MSGVSLGIAVLIALPLGLILSRRAMLATPVLGTLGVVYTIPGFALFAFLVPVAEMFQPEMLSVGQQAQKIARVFAPGDNQNVADARFHQRLDGIVDHRFVVNRQQVFVGDIGQGIEPASAATG